MTVSWPFSSERCAFIGMVHLRPLPGSPGWNGNMNAIVEQARADAEALLEGGVDGLMIENMHDLPYLKGQVWPETTAAMTLCAHHVVELAGKVPVGIQLLAAANREALGVAVAVGARFLRVEAFAYAHVADEGWLDASAATLVRARSHLHAASRIALWADVKKKHAAHAVTADLSVEEAAHGAAFCGADALVVTGVATGAPTSLSDIQAASAAGLPVVVGSGVTEATAHSLGEAAEALIVGTALKEDGDWRASVDVRRVKKIASALR